MKNKQIGEPVVILSACNVNCRLVCPIPFSNITQDSGGCRDLKMGGGSSAVELLGSTDSCYTFSHVSYIFLVRVDNKIHIANIAC